MSEMGTLKTSRLKKTVERQQSLGVVFVLMASLTLGFGGGWLGANSRDETMASTSQAAQKQIISNEGQLISSIAKQVSPSVVSVNVSTTSQQQDYFGFSQPVDQESAGTGIIISKDGYIVTNRHVVPAGTTKVSVTLSDGTELTDVEVVGRTSSSDSLDIAFLKVKDAKGKTLTPAKLGDSSKLEIGDRVIAIGNALGQFQNTVTSGIISGFGRSVEAGDASGSGDSETLQNLIQTDAAINEGNSGGPLVDLNGNVIGINTAIAGQGAQNIGFTIPINDAKGLITSVLTSGKVERPYLGVRYVALTDDYAYQYNLSVKRGAYVAPSSNGSSIVAGSPAEKAGIKEKDIITKVDGVSIDDTHSLTSLVGQHAVGDEVTLTIVRSGKTQDIKVKLQAAPQQ